jgi:hypothetical protein
VGYTNNNNTTRILQHFPGTILGRVVVQRFTAESKNTKAVCSRLSSWIYGARLWLSLWSTLNDIVLLKKIKTFSFSLTNTMLFARPDIILENENSCNVT